jgi:hypothetical protein
LSQSGSGDFEAKASGCVLPAPEMDIGHRRRHIGCGWGATFDAARKAAEADAIINYNSHFMAEEKFEQGKFVDGYVKYEASGCVFEVELLEYRNVDGVCFVKVICEASQNADREREIVKQKVKVKGWGVTEELAREDALRNAVDVVFGRDINAMLEESNGAILSQKTDDSSFSDGYVEKSKIKQINQKMGLYEVSVSADVRRRCIDKGFGLIGWIVMISAIIIISLLLCAVHPVLGLIFFCIALIAGIAVALG